jgi:two-component system, chemotaxis family, chemotaxis protein CheY
VDDSNIIRRKIERCNDSEKFHVVASAANGIEAIKHFKEAHPDVVTMDLTMPEMDGIACIQQLIALNANVRILVISALSDKATGIAALKKGARGFLCKPFTEQQLMDALVELTEDDNG